MGTKTRAIVSVAAASVMAWGGTSAKAQEQEKKPFKIRYTVGVGAAPEWRIRERWGENPFFPTFGVSFEAHITRHSGVEIGVYDRSSRYSWNEYIRITKAPPPPAPGEYDIITHSKRAHWLSIWWGYKVRTVFLDVGVGFNYDIGLGSQAGNDYIGPYFTLSKDIALYRDLLLELRLHINPTFSSGRWGSRDYAGTNIGPGVKIKYRF